MYGQREIIHSIFFPVVLYEVKLIDLFWNLDLKLKSASHQDEWVWAHEVPTRAPGLEPTVVGKAVSSL